VPFTDEQLKAKIDAFSYMVTRRVVATDHSLMSQIELDETPQGHKRLIIGYIKNEEEPCFYLIFTDHRVGVKRIPKALHFKGLPAADEQYLSKDYGTLYLHYKANTPRGLIDKYGDILLGADEINACLDLYNDELQGQGPRCQDCPNQLSCLGSLGY
jgi:hypothetical protein